MNRLTQGHNNLTQGQNTLTQNHVALAQAQSLTNSKIDSILERLAALTMIPSSPKSPPTSPPSPSPPSPFWPHMKLDIPRFDGQDPLWWIFKITQFFDY